MSSAHTSGGSSYSARSGLSKSWKTVKAHSGVYTGGKVEIFQQKDGGASLIACMLNDDVAILDAATGELKRTLQQDVEDVRMRYAVVSSVFALRKWLTTYSSLHYDAWHRKSRRSRSWCSPCALATTSL